MADIFVHNRNDFDHEDMFNGVHYVFPANQKVQISEAAAQHMFGKGLVDKTETLVRLGWANKFDPSGKKGWVDDPEGVKKLANFVFTTGKLVEVPIEDLAGDDLGLDDTRVRKAARA